MSIGSKEPPGTYSRPVSAEWTQLVDVATAELVALPQAPPTPEVVETLFDAVAPMDNESLDRVRYYGLGLVMCGVAKALHQPETRQQLIDEAATGLTYYWSKVGSHSRNGLLFSDLSDRQLTKPFDDLATNAYNSLPQPDRLVSDVLHKESKMRQDSALGRPFPDMDHDYHVNAVVKGLHTTGDVVGYNFTAATTTVLRTVLNKRHENGFRPGAPEIKSGKDLPYRDPSPALKEVIDPDEFGNLGLGDIALRCAVLRMDEFLQGVENYVDLDDRGYPVFRKDLVVPSRGLTSPEVFENGTQKVAVLHDARLKCPAVFVAGLIPMTVDIVTETIRTAQEHVEEVVMQRDYNSWLGDRNASTRPFGDW